MIKTLLAIALTLVGGEQAVQVDYEKQVEQVEQEQAELKVITEEFEIVYIEGEEVFGDLTEGTGEGIFYYKEQYREMGIENIEVGQVVKVSWTEYDYENELWDNIYSIEIVK